MKNNVLVIIVYKLNQYRLKTGAAIDDFWQI